VGSSKRNVRHRTDSEDGSPIAPKVAVPQSVPQSVLRVLLNAPTDLRAFSAVVDVRAQLDVLVRQYDEIRANT
jgi:hypothetical protein